MGIEHLKNKYYKVHWTEYFRIVTPFLLLIMTWIGSGVTSKIDKMDLKIVSIDEKLFHHLTNADLHIPRAQLVTKEEWLSVQKFRDDQIRLLQDGQNSILTSVDGIKGLLLTHMDKIK